MEAALKISDFDFLIERFSLLPEKREYELPSDYIQKVRYLDKSLSPFPGKFSRILRDLLCEITHGTRIVESDDDRCGFR